MNRNVMKYYHPQAHSFDTVPTNGEVGNQSPVDLVALDLSHPSAVSSTNSPRSNRTLRPKRTEQRLDHGGTFENPLEMTQDPPPSPPAVGRGRGLENQPSTFRRGRGRAATQGEIISIPNNIREKSLAETRLKRARHDTDEPPDIAEEIKLEDEYTTSANKRGKISCDQCYNRKTKCHRKVDGKSPSEQFPCDYCIRIQTICSTHLANGKKPESLIVGMENDYKRYKFGDILNDGIEQENHKLRQQLGGLQEKFESTELVHNGVVDQLKAVHRHNLTLEKAQKTAYEMVEQLKKSTRRKKKMATGQQMEIDDFGAEQGYSGAGVHQTDTFSNPFVDSATGTAEMGTILFPGPNQDEGGPQQSAQGDLQFAVDQMVPRQSLEPAADPESVVQSGKARQQEVFHGVRSHERSCSDTGQANDCLAAYFENVHPFIPVLHREAFYGLYRLYRDRVPTIAARSIRDASTLEGRAVMLISSVLALGALTITVDEKQENSRQIDASALANFGLGLGFYATCSRLSAYTHDNIETMLAYFFMGVFAAHTTDMRESFRRLQQFQVQAIAVNLPMYSKGKELGHVYKPDLWPQVSYLLIYEMGKRAWSLYQLYVTNVFLALDRQPCFPNLQVELPTPVDDQYLGLGCSSIEEYGKAPNPVTFILSLQELSVVVLAYAELNWAVGPQPGGLLLEKRRQLLQRLWALQRTIPSFLQWDTPATEGNPPWLRMQRARLQSLHECVSMRLHWAIMSLDPVFNASHQRHRETDSYSAFLLASTRVLDIAKESVVVNNHARCLFHADAIRATAALLQMILRKVTQERAEVDKYISSCRDGIAIGRSLVPKVFARAEGIFERLLNEHLEQLNAVTPMSVSNLCSPVGDLPDNNSIYQLFEMPLLEETTFLSASFFSEPDYSFGMYQD